MTMKKLLDGLIVVLSLVIVAIMLRYTPASVFKLGLLIAVGGLFVGIYVKKEPAKRRISQRVVVAALLLAGGGWFLQGNEPTKVRAKRAAPETVNLQKAAATVSKEPSEAPFSSEAEAKEAPFDDEQTNSPQYGATAEEPEWGPTSEEAQETKSDAEYSQEESANQQENYVTNDQGLIKGSNNGKYHVPGSRHYDDVTNPKAWFSSVEEAQRAGYEKARG